jgi:E3 ubiquitin-protein ligase DOA10
MSMSVQMALTWSSIPKSVKAWASGVSAVIEGVDECYICYSVVHVESNSIPSKKCSTCKNAYHKECIFRWFRTSGKTLCPICQTPF